MIKLTKKTLTIVEFENIDFETWQNLYYTEENQIVFPFIEIQKTHEESYDGYKAVIVEHNEPILCARVITYGKPVKFDYEFEVIDRVTEYSLQFYNPFQKFPF